MKGLETEAKGCLKQLDLFAPHTDVEIAVAEGWTSAARMSDNKEKGLPPLYGVDMTTPPVTAAPRPKAKTEPAQTQAPETPPEASGPETKAEPEQTPAVDMWSPIPDDDPTVRSILQVPMEDVYNGPTLATGVRSIDDRLYGGIRAGGVCIIAGHEGGGKTSWALQIFARAIMADEKRRQAKNPDDPPLSRGMAVFSSEMPAKKLHRILAHQLAEDGEILPTGNKYYPKYEVSEEVDQRIIAAYDPWIRVIEPELKPWGWNRLTQTCEKQAEQGRKYIILDNLMTLSNLVGMDNSHRGQNENSLQLAVVAWAAEFAARYDVWVILIAHTRKASKDDVFADNLNDLISGSKSVPNLASVVLFFTMLPLDDRQDDPDTSDRLARLTKIRDFDKKLVRGVRTEFDPASWTIREKPIAE